MKNVVPLSEILTAEQIDFNNLNYKKYINMLQNDELIGGEKGYLKTLLIELKSEIEENYICGTSYMIYNNNEMMPVGYLYISDIYGMIEPYVSVSYAIFEQYRRKGYAREILKNISKVLPSDEPIVKLVIDNENLASQKLVQSLGYQIQNNVPVNEDFCVYQNTVTRIRR